MFRSFDLKKVLIMAFTSISIGVVFFISILNALSTYQSAKSVLEETLATSAQTVAIRVDGYIGSILSALNAGVINQANRLIDANHEIRHQALIKVLASHKGLREVWSVDEKGYVLELVSRFSIAHTNGLSFLWQPKPYKKIKLGDVFFSDIQLTEKSSEPLINVAVPLSRGGRLTGGMIVASLSLKYLWDVLNILDLKEGRSSFALSRNGVLVGHSNTALVFSKNVIPADILETFFAHRNVLSREYRNVEGTLVIGGFSLIERLGIGVILEAPEEEAFQAAFDGIVLDILVALGAILISIWTGIFLAKLLVRPLLKLSEAADEITNAKKYKEVEVAGTVETRILGSAFNKMTRRLSTSISQLETEIEAKRKTEQVLRESEERFRSLIENALDITVILGEGGEILFVSPSVFSVLGYDAQELIGQSAWPYIHPEDLRNIQQIISRSNPQNRKLDAFEGRFRHKNKSWHLLESVGRNLLDVPAVSGIVINSRDITERLTLEEKLRRAQKMEAVGQLTSGIAHDFNNILGIIQGNLEIMNDMVQENDPVLGRIEKAQLGVDRGTEITRKLLGFSRTDSQSVVPTVINDLVGNLEELIARSLTASITVNVNLDDNLWKTAIDPGELEDAILNLSLNARDAMPDGGTLLLETANKVLDDSYVKNNPESKTGEFVMVSVSDTGSGMSEEIKERVLEPFFTTKEVSKGTGLGLSMVYGFVQRVGGHISIYSEVGKGTTFQLYLPRAVDTVKSEDVQQEATADLPGGNESILVVDDEADLRDIAVSYLNDLGYRTLAAENGGQALQILNSEKGIDAVFSDVVMPGDLNGYQLAMAIHEDFPRLKMLLTSGFAKAQSDILNGSDNREYMDKLNIDLLGKPYNKVELANALRKTLDLDF